MATARSFGNYDLPAALADLIDNSIQAKASQVWIEFDPNGDDVTVRIRDDGVGMDRGMLIDAMKPASRDPAEKRDQSDLGRFGWGMKSASLSQARVLTVVSWTASGSANAARWDIDDLDDWSMDLFEQDDALSLLASARESPSGTEVIWTNCDRLYEAHRPNEVDEQLNEKIAYARKQLALVFHRYLAGEARVLQIVLQGIRVEPVDPFMTSHPATQSLDEERVSATGGTSFCVKPYVIPHFSKLSVAERQVLGGEEGLVRNQGFYVYRNKRLIIHGTWFRLMPHGELTQLTRVRIDLPNSLDSDWKITLDKSDAQLPSSLRKRLREIVQKFSRKSIGANRRRGVDINTPGKTPVWRRNAHSGRIRYLINREHPIIQEMVAGSSDPFITSEALRLVEACIPVDTVSADAAASGSALVQAVTDPEEFEALVRACMLSYLRQSDTPTVKGLLQFARDVEPFSDQWKYAESFIREKAMKDWKIKDD